LRIVATLALLGAALWALSFGLGQVPQGTKTSSLVIRGLVGLGVGLVLVVIVRRMLHALVAAPPIPPRTVDVRSTDVVYVCPVCKTRVRLEVAASIPGKGEDADPRTPKAPKHCGEEMELQPA